MVWMIAALISSCEEADQKMIIQEGEITSWGAVENYVTVYFSNPDPDDGIVYRRCSFGGVKVHSWDGPQVAKVIKGIPPSQPSWSYIALDIWLSPKDAKKLRAQMR
jgi:hypothetical protein